MTTREWLALTLSEMRCLDPASVEYAAARRAAWKYAQILDGIPACEWTPPPAGFGPGYQKEAA